MVNKILEGTALLILVYLVLANANGFAQVTKALGDAYSGSVKTLQGN